MRLIIVLSIAAACFGQAKQNVVQTGTVDARGATWLPPSSTFASPPATPATGSVYIFTDASAVGTCSGGGSSLATCRWSGSAWAAVGGGGGGSGTAPYLSSLIAGPDSTKTITGATHGFATTALLVAVYDNASPRNAISVAWTVNASTYAVVVTFGSPQSNYYVVINGGVGPAGPTGPTGASGAGSGTVNSGTMGQVVAYTGAGTTVGGVTLTANGVVLGGGAGNPTVTAADTTTTHALFATAGAPAFRAIVAGDIPALNQTTTGTAANITGVAAVANGGTGTASTLTGLVRGSASAMTAAELSGDITTSGSNAATIVANAVTSAKMAVVNTRRTGCIPFGWKNATAVLADTDLADSDQYFVPVASTLVEITVRGDAGTPNIILGRDRAGSVVNLTSAALATASSGAVACSNAGGTTGLNGATTCSSTLQNTGLVAGDWIVPVSGTAGGTAKQMTACLTWVVN